MPFAARLNDMHFCPMSSPNSHGGGPIIGPGCITVMIGGKPAARVGDALLCNGPVDMVVQGSTNVFIGGAPAARMGDVTAHGGNITTGCVTVDIGG